VGIDLGFSSLEAEGENRFRSLRRELGITSFGMNLITLLPGERGRIHAHERQEEVYAVLSGELTLLVQGGEEHVLGANRVARVGPSVRRQLVNRGPQSLVLLALGSAGEPAGRDGLAWESFDDEGEGRPPQDVPLPENLPG
jgi:uncharacterized cupin superfamily protein